MLHPNSQIYLDHRLILFFILIFFRFIIIRYMTWTFFSLNHLKHFITMSIFLILFNLSYLSTEQNLLFVNRFLIKIPKFYHHNFMYFSLRKMKELIEEQCKYGTRDQLLLYENSLVEDLMGDQGKSDRFPCTSTENPVFLYHCIDPGNSTEDHPGKPFVRKCVIINILIHNVILCFCY